MTSIKIVNVVGHLDFRRELELSTVAELFTESESVSRVRYEPSENHWLQSWFESPTKNIARYVAFYRSGTAIATGCESVEEFQSLATEVESVMEPAIEQEVLRDIKNIVLTGDVRQAVDLSTLTLQLGFEDVEYEPEQFPGLLYRDSERDCVFLVFASGRIVCTGLDNVEEAETAAKGFIEELAKLL